MEFKTKLGVACVVAGVSIVAALPGISGVVAGHAMESELSPLAESLGYSIQEMSFDRDFSSTQVHILLQGEGLKSLNNESIELTGVLSHGGITDFPVMVAGDLDLSQAQGSGEDRIAVTGTVYPQITWSGGESAQFDVNPVVIPLDPETGSVMALDGYSGSFDSGNSQPGEVDIKLSGISLQVAEGGYEVASIQLSPSLATFTPQNRNWELQAEDMTLSIPEFGKDITVENLELGGNEVTADGLVSSKGFFKTGQMSFAPEGDVLLKSVKAEGTIENVSVAALGNLTELVNDNEEIDSKTVESTLLQALESLPRYALDHLSVDTGNGAVEISFDMAATESTAATVKSLLANPPQNEVQEYLAMQNLVNNIRSSARIQVSEELIGWGCELTSSQDIADPVQARAVAAACKGLVEGGHFLNMVCTQGDWSCVQKMEQVRVVWEKERALELSLDEGRVLLNKVEFEAEGLL